MNGKTTQEHALSLKRRRGRPPKYPLGLWINPAAAAKKARSNVDETNNNNNNGRPSAFSAEDTLSRIKQTLAQPHILLKKDLTLGLSRPNVVSGLNSEFLANKPNDARNAASLSVQPDVSAWTSAMWELAVNIALQTSSEQRRPVTVEMNDHAEPTPIVISPDNSSHEGDFSSDDHPLDLSVKRIPVIEEATVSNPSILSSTLRPLGGDVHLPMFIQHIHPMFWSVDQVAEFVQRITHEYGQLFKEHEIDGSVLLHLTDQHLVNHLHMKLGPAMKLRLSVETLASAQPT